MGRNSTSGNPNGRNSNGDNARHDVDAPSLQVASLYGLTPKVQDAILAAVDAGQDNRVRMLMAPLHPADQADLLERVKPSICAKLITALGSHLDPEAIAFLDEEGLEQVLDVLGPDAIAQKLPALDSDDVVTIAEELEPDELDEMLQAMPAQDRVLVEQALAYPEDSAGRLMQREMVVVPPFWTVGQTIDFLRSSDLAQREFHQIMVTNPAAHPIGEVPLSRLLCTQRQRRISEIMEQDVRSIPVLMDQEEVAVLFRRYGMISAGVIDDEGRLVGIVTQDDVMDVMHEEAEEDLMALAGVSDSNIRISVFETLKGRAGWLMVNLLTAILASVVIGLFEKTIEQLVILAVLMPIVASMGGNAGTQTVTVAVRAIALREFGQTKMLEFARKELLVGILNGLIFALIAAGFCLLWFDNIDVALVLGGAMAINLVVAALSGALIPLTLVRVGVDPAVASSVFLTTVTDVIGFFVFLGLAGIFLL